MMTTADETCTVRPAEAGEAGDYLARCGSAHLFLRPGWDAVFAAYRLEVERLVAVRGGSIVGILPLVWQNSLLFGNRLVSLPWFDAAGFLADDDEAAKSLVAAALDQVCRRRARKIEFRQLRPVDGWTPERGDKIAMRLALESDPERLWKRLDPKVRNQVRKGEKSNLKTETGGAELVDEFFRMYSTNMRDLASPSHSRAFFEAILTAFPDEARIHVVRLEGRVVGAGLTLANGATLEIPWASSLKEFNRLCVNHAMYWHILRQACSAGHQWFNFGRSSRESGQHHFKKQWGAEETPLFWYALSPDGRCLTSDAPPQESFGLAVAIWPHLPLWLTRRLGPRIIRKLS